MSGTPGKLLGVFIAQLDDAYQIAVWRGIDSRAREKGMGVVSFVGHRVHSPLAAEEAANIAYRLADPGAVDGLIVVTSAIATFLSATETGGLFAGWDGGPRVSVGLEVPGVASVVADGTRAVTQVVRHLVRDHSLRRLALVGGPGGHPEAEQGACVPRRPGRRKRGV